MPNPSSAGEREKVKARLFDLVFQNATKKQWAEWLRVPLEHAAAAGDVALVNSLLALGANGEAGWRGCHNRTLLCAAAQGGKVEVVESLLKAGARPDVNVLGGEWLRSPLHYAVLNGCERIAEVLLLSGACPDYRDRAGIAPIHIAAERGYEGIVSLLLTAGVKVDMPKPDGTTSLHRAAKMGHSSVVTRLLIAGASASSRTGKGYSALDFAVMRGHVDVIRLLAQRGHHVECSDSKSTTLHIAASRNQASAVDVLVDLGGRVMGRETATMGTPLHVAAYRGSCDALVALLRHKADVHAKMIDGESPLMLACSNLHQKAADLLLRWGADETDADNEGRSAEQLIGTRLEEGERAERWQDMESMRKLLANAPADRAWRRRGLLVLCRAIRNEACFDTANNQDDGGNMAKKVQTCGRTSTITLEKTQRMDASTSSDDCGGEVEKSAASIASAEHEAWADSCSVEARVVGMEDESIFRHIASFL